MKVYRDDVIITQCKIDCAKDILDQAKYWLGALPIPAELRNRDGNPLDAIDAILASLTTLYDDLDNSWQFDWEHSEHIQYKKDPH